MAIYYNIGIFEVDTELPPETPKEVTRTQESLDRPDERLQQRLSFAAEEQGGN